MVKTEKYYTVNLILIWISGGLYSTKFMIFGLFINENSVLVSFEFIFEGIAFVLIVLIFLRKLPLDICMAAVILIIWQLFRNFFNFFFHSRLLIEWEQSFELVTLLIIMFLCWRAWEDWYVHQKK